MKHNTIVTNIPRNWEPGVELLSIKIINDEIILKIDDNIKYLLTHPTQTLRLFHIMQTALDELRMAVNFENQEKN